MGAAARRNPEPGPGAEIYRPTDDQPEPECGGVARRQVRRSKEHDEPDRQGGEAERHGDAPHCLWADASRAGGDGTPLDGSSATEPEDVPDEGQGRAEEP